MYKKFICFILVFIALGSRACFGQDFPACMGNVNDRAGIIDLEYKNKIETLLDEIKAKTSVNIFVLTVDSIKPHNEKDYAQGIFDFWRIGENDKAILFLLCANEKTITILTTESLDRLFSQDVKNVIADSAIAPYMKEGRYGEGIYNGLVFLSTLIAQDANVTFDSAREYAKILPPVKWEENIFRTQLLSIVFIIIVMIAVLAFIRLVQLRQLKRKHGYHDIYWWTGGYGGGNGFSIGGFGGFGGGFS